MSPPFCAHARVSTSSYHSGCGCCAEVSGAASLRARATPVGASDLLGGAGCSHARKVSADARACAAFVWCISWARWQQCSMPRYLKARHGSARCLAKSAAPGGTQPPPWRAMLPCRSGLSPLACGAGAHMGAAPTCLGRPAGSSPLESNPTSSFAGAPRAGSIAIHNGPSASSSQRASPSCARNTVVLCAPRTRSPPGEGGTSPSTPPFPGGESPSTCGAAAGPALVAAPIPWCARGA